MTKNEQQLSFFYLHVIHTFLFGYNKRLYFDSVVKKVVPFSDKGTEIFNQIPLTFWNIPELNLHNTWPKKKQRNLNCANSQWHTVVDCYLTGT